MERRKICSRHLLEREDAGLVVLRVPEQARELVDGAADGVDGPRCAALRPRRSRRVQEAGAAEGLDQERSHCVKQSFWSESFSRVLEVEFDII